MPGLTGGRMFAMFCQAKKTELITLLTGAAVVVILTFFAFEILHAPLMITDAKSDLADPTQAESKRTFTLAVQGPIVDLHKSLSRLVNQRVRYRAKGTGLIWLDYDQKKSNAIKVRNIARRKLVAARHKSHHSDLVLRARDLCTPLIFFTCSACSLYAY